MEIIEAIMIGGAVFLVWAGVSALWLYVLFTEVKILSKVFRRKDD